MSSSSSIHEKGSSNAHVSQVGGIHYVSAHGGQLQPGPYEAIATQKKIANPAPLGLCAFALTSFVLALVNLRANSVHEPNVVIALAFAYGGLIQLLAGMWEMAIGNTFGATALSSYGGFWLSFAIVLTPAFKIADAYTDPETGVSTFNEVFALYLYGWVIFTFLLTLLTLRSTVALASLFIVLDAAFLCLSLTQQTAVSDPVSSARHQKAAGVFGLVAAFLAWYNAFAGMANSTNFWFTVPDFHLPWSEKKKSERSQV